MTHFFLFFLYSFFAGKIRIDDGSFSGIIFVGGFSYADVLDSAKGWAACITQNDDLQAQAGGAGLAHRDGLGVALALACDNCLPLDVRGPPYLTQHWGGRRRGL